MSGSAVGTADVSEMATVNVAALGRARLAEQLSLAFVSLPAVLLIVLLVLLPGAWLLGLSFLDQHGQPTLGNYAAIFVESTSLQVLGITLGVSVLTTAISLALGYPVAYFLAALPPRIAGYCLIAVLVPFWTSLLVRTYAWLVLLQRKGLVNTALLDTGLIDQPLRLANGMTGTVIGMVHIMLPYMVLPLYGAMRSIGPDYVRAAASLGAVPTRAFRDVYLPLTLPGLVAGSLMVFILCLGFYVTPALLGGGRVMMVSMRIERSIQLYADWGAGSAMGVVLLVCVALLGIVAAQARRLAESGRGVPR